MSCALSPPVRLRNQLGLGMQGLNQDRYDTVHDVQTSELGYRRALTNTKAEAVSFT